MPTNGTTDATEYDRFDYTGYDQPRLSLEEAVRKASELRSADPAKIHRIVPADRDVATFYIDSIPAEDLYADLITRVMRHWYRWSGKITK